MMWINCYLPLPLIFKNFLSAINDHSLAEKLIQRNKAKYFWIILHVTFLSTITASSLEASSENKLSIESQVIQSSFLRVVQAGASDSSKLANKSTEQSISLPAIKSVENKPSITYYRRDMYAD